MTDKARDEDGVDVRVDGEEDEIQVEVYDDRPEEDRRDPVDLNELDDEDDLTDEEVAALGKRAQKRIKQLTFKYNEARRQAEEKERLAQTAQEHARQTRALAERALAESRTFQGAYLKQQTESSGMSVKAATEQLKAAYEDGDPEQIAQAQLALNEAQIAASNASRAQEYYARVSQPETEAEPEQAPPPVQFSDRTKRWMRDNPWFGVDRELTQFARTIHESIVLAGVEPESDEYWSQLDTRIRRIAPDRFEGDEAASTRTRSRKSTVTPASRSSSSTGGNGVVRLSRSEKETAEALGVPLEEYARQKLLYEQQNREG